MKLVMLGHTGVGKTTYMASLYGVLQHSLEGFCLNAVNSEDHQQLLELSTAIARGQYPSPSAVRSEYQFCLRYQAQDVLHFTWADYRGGAILQTQNNQEAQQLVQDLRAADGIMMFCDCQAIANGDIRSNQIGRMTSLVTHALQDLNHPLSVAIVLTKTDLIAKFDEKIFNYFDGIISIIEASELITGSLIPVACGIRLINVPMPLLFALHTAVNFHAVDLSQSAVQHLVNSQELEQKSKGINGFFRLLNDSWNGKPSTTELAAIEKQNAIQKAQEYQSIAQPVKALNKYMQQLPLIQRGNNLNQYLQQLLKIQFGTTLNQQKSESLYQTYTNPFDAFS